MSKASIPIPVAIFIAGFVAGYLTSSGIKYDVPTDEIEIGFLVLEKLCTISKSESKPDCSMIPIITPIVSILLGLLIAWIEAIRMSSWKIGLAIYCSGWILGFLYLLSLFK